MSKNLFLLKGDCGEVRFEQTGGQLPGVISSETVSFTAKATSNPLENGYAINDHAYNEAVKFTIPGFCVDSACRDTLERMWKANDLLEYQGIERLANLIILSLSIGRQKEHGEGFSFNLSLQQMNIEAPEIAGLSMSDEQASSGAAKKTSSAGLVSKSKETVSVESYLQKISGLMKKSASKDIAGARTNPSTPGY
jgi:hypothetical protein